MTKWQQANLVLINIDGKSEKNTAQEILKNHALEHYDNWIFSGVWVCSVTIMLP